MSSFTRRIERQVRPSRAVHPVLDVYGEPTRKLESYPPRAKFFGGRGSKLGVRNPKDKALVARLAREARRRIGAA